MEHLPIYKPRAIGHETEYGLHPQPDEFLGQDVIYYNLPPDIHVATIRNFAANGARIYVDQGKNLEYATPEVITTNGLLTAHFAGEQIIKELADTAFDRQRPAQKRTIDMMLQTRGDHENYLTGNLDSPRAIGERLLTHLVTRPIISGPGMILPTESEHMYVLEQKLWDADPVKLIGGTSTIGHEKSFILIRDEHFDATGSSRRLNIISGSANMFAFPIAYRFFSTSLVLRLIENKKYPNQLVLYDPFIAALDTATDLDLQKPLRLANDKEYTAAQIQHTLASASVEFAQKHTELPEDERKFADLWALITSDILDGNIEKWSDYIEWVKKRQYLERKMQKEGIGLSHPRSLEREIKWHSLDDNNPVFQLRERGRVAFMPSADEIAKARTMAPDPTRARLRGAAVEKYGASLETADWNWWCPVNGKTTRANDVLADTIAA
jgi:proteasome accessory factor A